MSLVLWLESDETLDAATLPSPADFRQWAEAALALAGDPGATQDVELSIRLVGAAESQALNRDYRDKDKPTNVLSFPADLPEMILAELDARPLGDLAICAPVVLREADEQGKTAAAHWAHMTVHGLLHLLGHDHVEAADAARMEPLEIAILARLGVDNPYDDDAAADPAPQEKEATR